MSRLRHARAKRLLDGYVDDELAGPRRVRVDYHLDECPDCAAHVRLLLAIRRSLRRLSAPDAEALARLQPSDPFEGA